MALLLHIETGTDVCSVALSKNDSLLSLRESTGGRDHATQLGGYVDEILKENNISAEELDAISIGMGPGSYTGLRIGVSLAKGLCYSLGIPLIGIGSLEAMVYVAKEDFDAGILGIENWDNLLLCPMIDARRMEVYAEIFNTEIESLSPIQAEVVTSESFAEFIDSDKEFVIFGNGAKKTVEILGNDRVKYVNIVSSARGLVVPAYKAFQAERFDDIAYFEPLYLKDFVVLKSTKKLF